jgi:uroporphyrinogen-III synthase
MRLLLTRAQPGAGASAERLARLGHSVLVEPMLRIESLPQPVDLPAPAALVFTSANGVWASAKWPAAERWRDVPVFAVGPATAEACRAAGYRHVRAADGSADSLLAAVRNEVDPWSGTILYAVAELPAKDLESALSASGFAVRRAVAYRAIPSTHLSMQARRALAGSAIDAVLFYSERAAAAFVALVEAEALRHTLENLDLVALSPQVARPLAGLAPRQLLVAARPDEDALFACLR